MKCVGVSRTKWSLGARKYGEVGVGDHLETPFNSSRHFSPSLPHVSLSLCSRLSLSLSPSVLSLFSPLHQNHHHLGCWELKVRGLSPGWRIFSRFRSWKSKIRSVAWVLGFLLKNPRGRGSNSSYMFMGCVMLKC